MSGAAAPLRPQHPVLISVSTLERNLLVMCVGVRSCRNNKEGPMTQFTQTSLGELISTIYEEFYDLYNDHDLASVATASLINDMLSEELPVNEDGRAAA